MKILALATDPHDTISEIRLGLPLRGLAKQMGWALRMAPFHTVTRRALRWADVVVMQRPCAPRELRRMNWLCEQGIPVIYEIDDLLIEPAPHLRGVAHLRAQAGAIRTMLGRASAISAATPRLAERLAGFGPPVALVPNYGATSSAGDGARHEDGPPVTLVLAASDRQGVGPVLQALTELRDEAGPGFELLVIGPIAEGLDVQTLQAQALPLLRRDEFFARLAGTVNPVGLIPLDDSPFSRCKSAVKYFDYAALGMPSACADRPPYADVIRSGENGLLCDDTPQSWKLALRHLLRSAAERRRLAEGARRTVNESHTLVQTQAAWRLLLERVRRPRPARPPLRQLADAAVDLLEQWQVGLRELNRRRVHARRRHPRKIAP